jgi:hypothetical protein
MRKSEKSPVRDKSPNRSPAKINKKEEKKQSQPVQNIRKYLDKKNIEYKQEFTFKGCRDKNVLPFDFCLIINGRIALIEYDGEQHFSISSRFHGTGQQAKTKFEKGRRHDETKTKYAYQNYISLLRISYREQDQYQEWIDRYLATLNKPTYLFSNNELYSNQISLTGQSSCCMQ